MGWEFSLWFISLKIEERRNPARKKKGKGQRKLGKQSATTEEKERPLQK